MQTTLKTAPALITQGHQKASYPWRLRLTVVFHPDWQRVGHFVDVLQWNDRCSMSKPLEVGRFSPAFSDDRPLLEPHVSRSALKITLGPPNPEMLEGVHGAVPSLRLRIPEGASGLIGPQELTQCVADPEQLLRGIGLRLGHGVVLLLRVVQDPDCPESVPQAPAQSSGLVGTSPEMARLRYNVLQAANTAMPALLLGESGSGKEVAAREIHRLSARALQPMVAVNMAVIPDTLAASELFGCVKGAYTGALARLGYMREADGGSLFLDEIADAPESVQAQLLRAVQEGEVQVVGGGIQRVDVRFIAATDADLGEGSKFRHALLTRLSGHRIVVPPLRYRLEDVGTQGVAWLIRNPHAIVSHLTFLNCGSNDLLAAAWARFFFNLLKLTFKGNSRELLQLVTRAASGDQTLIELNDRMPSKIDPQDEAETSITPEHLAEVFAAHDYELQATADALGMNRASLRRRVVEHPDLVLITDISDDEIRRVASDSADLADLARRLKVSRHALRPRLRQLGLT